MISTSPAVIDGAPAPMPEPGAGLPESLPLVHHVVRSVARRYGLSPDEEAELRSETFFRLIDDDGAVMRAFRGESRLSTYLKVVVTRLLLDRRVRAWGKWRPSQRARRLGMAAIYLERLIIRERLAPVEAIRSLVEHPGYDVASRDARTLYNALQVKARPIEIALEDVGPSREPADLAAHPFEVSECEAQASRVTAALRAAIHGLERGDRRLIRLRFRRGASVAEIARESGLDQKTLYRDFERIYRRLRILLEAQGVQADDIRDVLGRALAQVRTAITDEA